MMSSLSVLGYCVLLFGIKSVQGYYYGYYGGEGYYGGYYGGYGGYYGGYGGYYGGGGTCDPCSSSESITLNAIGESQSFQTPGFETGSYCTDLSCGWLIRAPAGSVIQITWSTFSTEQNYDGATIYDGPDNSSPGLATCTGPSCQTLYSTANQMFVYFSSDYIQNGPGFDATATAIAAGGGVPTPAPTTPDPLCACSVNQPISLTFSGDAATITTPGYPVTPYCINQQCGWTFDVPSGMYATINFDYVDTEPNYDGVMVFDGSGPTDPQLTVCTGNACTPAPTVASTGQQMFVLFTSDYIQTAMGFSAVVTAVAPTTTTTTPEPTTTSTTSTSTTTTTPDPCTCSLNEPISLTFAGDSETISTPGYPITPYCKSQTCSWTIDVPSGMYAMVNFDHVDTYDMYDGIAIYDDSGPTPELLIGICYQDNCFPSTIMTSTGQQMHLGFESSDDEQTGMGFSATVTAVGPTTPPAPTTTTTTLEPTTTTTTTTPEPTTTTSTSTTSTSTATTPNPTTTTSTTTTTTPEPTTSTTSTTSTTTTTPEPTTTTTSTTTTPEPTTTSTTTTTPEPTTTTTSTTTTTPEPTTSTTTTTTPEPTTTTTPEPTTSTTTTTTPEPTTTTTSTTTTTTTPEPTTSTTTTTTLEPTTTTTSTTTLEPTTSTTTLEPTTSTTTTTTPEPTTTTSTTTTTPEPTTSTTTTTTPEPTTTTSTTTTTEEPTTTSTTTTTLEPTTSTTTTSQPTSTTTTSTQQPTTTTPQPMTTTSTATTPEPTTTHQPTTTTTTTKEPTTTPPLLMAPPATTMTTTATTTTTTTEEPTTTVTYCPDSSNMCECLGSGFEGIGANPTSCYKVIHIRQSAKEGLAYCNTFKSGNLRARLAVVDSEEVETLIETIQTQAGYVASFIGLKACDSEQQEEEHADMMSFGWSEDLVVTSSSFGWSPPNLQQRDFQYPRQYCTALCGQGCEGENKWRGRHCDWPTTSICEIYQP